MKTTNLFRLFTILSVLLASSNTANARIWRVNNNVTYNQFSTVIDPTNQVFSSLQTAIDSDAVVNGDTLLVEASVNDYGIIVLTKRLNIIGTGYFLDENLNLQNTAVTAKVLQLTFDINSSGSLVSGIEGSGSTSFGYNAFYFSNNPLNNITITKCNIAQIRFQNAVGTLIHNVVISKNFIVSINYISASFGGNGTIDGLIITNNYFANLTLSDRFLGSISQNVINNGVNIQGNEFQNNIVIGGTITPNNNSNSTMHHNIFTFALPSFLTAASNNKPSLNTNYIFQNYNDPSSDKKYQLRSVGSCNECYQGFNGFQIGMFGGSDPYVLSGIPAIPTIYKLQSVSTTGVGSSIPVTISSKSNN